MNKKGQQEIMGIALVLVLIFFAVFTIAKFSSSPDYPHKKEYVHSLLASTMLDALLSTTTSCNGLSFSQMLQNCADDPSGSVICDAASSCNYFEQESKKIFRDTLESQHISYELSVSYENKNPIIRFGEQCASKKSETFPLPTRGGALKVKLDICM